MASYSVTLTVGLKATVAFELEAKSLDEARKKAEEIAASTRITTWTGSEIGGWGPEWSEEVNDAQVEDVSKVE